MHRNPHSHKGENGKVAIIGGSATQHGAPLFSALAAEASGVDLVFVCLPRLHQQVARMQSLNVQVHPFEGDELSRQDQEPILELLATLDAAVIGPGLSREKEHLSVLQQLIGEISCPMVLDASALQPWTLETIRGKTAVITPHLGELERMGVAGEDLAKQSQKYGTSILLKGRTDRIAGPDGSMREIAGGNAGLTVGGTGDALAGLIAGLIAQKMDPVDACVMASTIIKRAGTMLYAEKGFAYTTREVIGKIPHLMRTYG